MQSLVEEKRVGVCTLSETLSISRRGLLKGASTHQEGVMGIFSKRRGGCKASVEPVAPDVPLGTGSMAGGNWLNPPCLPDCYLKQAVGGILILLHTLMNQTHKIKKAQETYITRAIK